jgi:hypothetical protein
MLRIGLDLHGVIDDNPYMFSTLAKTATEQKHEIYIVTGQEDSPALKKELIACGMDGSYKDILSITSYQKKLGTSITYVKGDKSQPMMDPEIWNPSKAMLCASAGIDFMIDDSEIYGKYFNNIRTQYILYSKKTTELLNFLCFFVGHRLM